MSKVTDQEEEPVYCIEKERAEHLEEIKIVTGKWNEAERNYKKLEKQSLSDTDLWKKQLEETGMQIESQNSVLENERNLHEKEIQTQHRQQTVVSFSLHSFARCVLSLAIIIFNFTSCGSFTLMYRTPVTMILHHLFSK